MNFARTKTIAKKEFKHLFRDWRLLILLLAFPVLLLSIFGYAVNFDVKDIKIAVLDNDNSDLSKDFIKSLNSTEYFNIIDLLHDDNNIQSILDTKKARCVCVIPNSFAENYYSNRDVKIQFLIDGVDANTANITKSYVENATASFNKKMSDIFLSRKGIKQFRPIEAAPVFWYNPDLKTTRFMLPGLISMILVVTAVISVSLSLVREKERGTIEQLNVSPVKTFELLIGKILPYFSLAIVNAAFIILLGYLLFDVQVKGSYFLLFWTTLLFLFASSSIGILISVISDSQQVAFTLATFISLLPSVILSGFIFQIDSMPKPLQILSNITPAKFYTVMLRSIILRGTGVSTFWEQVIYLIIFTVVVLSIATFISKRKEMNA